MTYITNTDYLIEASIGNVSGVETFVIKGKNQDLDIGSSENIWTTGGVHDLLSAGEIMQIVSTDAQDTNLSGSGTWTVLIRGLDDGFNLVSETVEMGGLGIVETVIFFRIIHDMEAVNTGGDQKNQGVITATAKVSLSIQGTIPIEEGRTRNGFFTIPLGKKGLIVGDTVINVARITGGGGNPVVQSMIFTQEDGKSINIWNDGVIDSSVSNDLIFPHSIQDEDVLPEKTHIKSMALTDTNNTEVRFDAQLMLFDAN